MSRLGPCRVIAWGKYLSRTINPFKGLNVTKLTPSPLLFTEQIFLVSEWFCLVGIAPPAPLPTLRLGGHVLEEVETFLNGRMVQYFDGFHLMGHSIFIFFLLGGWIYKCRGHFWWCLESSISCSRPDFVTLGNVLNPYSHSIRRIIILQEIDKKIKSTYNKIFVPSNLK